MNVHVLQPCQPPFPPCALCTVHVLHTGASFARHSGGHLNPALSLAAALSGHLSWFTCFVYIVSQVGDSPA
jgi:glycerol uptake facilitator-like aquaporin